MNICAICGKETDSKRNLHGKPVCDKCIKYIKLKYKTPKSNQ